VSEFFYPSALRTSTMSSNLHLMMTLALIMIPFVFFMLKLIDLFNT